MCYPAAYRCFLVACKCLSDVTGRCPVVCGHCPDVYLGVLGGWLFHHPFLGDSDPADATRPDDMPPCSGYCTPEVLALGVLS